ncbi:probable CCR4-associated factor 1 homolog 11 [Alnus glutinosa]|uniref:probable CCR4-associated factor 1 homolog 11 n=1 Tax=Alnus glutinosa TaxID=3517 RepID=UPI002D792583|nr:probable CCR4-associated factor 1 homolog 11 [Alnus glutinosa]
MVTPHPIVVREVWQDNLEQEFSEIARALPHHRFVALDTEFPGHVFPAPCRNHSKLSPAENYLSMKRNVDATKIIQLGLALCDANGDSCVVWQFNFRDFNKETDLLNPDSIALLERQGIDFQKNQEMGINSLDFARLIINSGLLRNPTITWATFHGAYDFGYLIKILIGRELPVFDIKNMIRMCDGLYGGLEKVAKALGVDRVAGSCHQAGSDSLLMLQTIMKLKNVHFFGKFLIEFQLVLYGLEVDRTRLLTAPKFPKIIYVMHPGNCCLSIPYCLQPIKCGPRVFQGSYGGYYV